MGVPGREFELELTSHRLHCQRFGDEDAPLVVGVHGLSLNMKAFDYVGERIGREFQLVAFDLRGRGKSPPTPPGSFGWHSHAFDVLALAEALGFDRFSIVGQSMGGSVAMKAAEMRADRVSAVVLVDVAGRVDRGVGQFIGSLMGSVHDEFSSVDAYLGAMRSQGLVDWDDHWERCYRYGVEETDGYVRSRVDRAALAEDRAYGTNEGGGLYVYERWKFLTMPTLLLRATQEFRPGIGHVVPADDAASFLRDVPHGSVVEIPANHLTINTHPETVDAIRGFLTRTVTTERTPDNPASSAAQPDA